MKLPPDFRDLLEEFARDGVDHVVIGGYAFGFHVQPRATKDLDVLLEGGAPSARHGRAIESARHAPWSACARSATA